MSLAGIRTVRRASDEPNEVLRGWQRLPQPTGDGRHYPGGDVIERS
jgi:hypothetical protein